MTTNTNARIVPLEPVNVTGKARTILDHNKQRFGAYLNFFSTLAHAPTVLEGYTGLAGTLGAGALTPRIREQIAVAVSSRNSCGYCLTAHGHAAVAHGVSGESLPALTEGRVADPRDQAAVDFALSVLDRQGRVSDGELEAVRTAGFTDGEILEIIAHVAMTFFSNVLNNVSEPVIDLPHSRSRCAKLRDLAMDPFVAKIEGGPAHRLRRRKDSQPRLG